LLISARISRFNEQGALVKKVIFILDGQIIGEKTAIPYEMWWNLELGKHTIAIEAELQGGKIVKSQEIYFEVAETALQKN